MDTSIIPKESRLIVTVHGIRTFGQWQERLENLVTSSAKDSKIEFVNYKYGYFSIIAFIIPIFRWLVVRKFRNELIKLCSNTPRSRIDLVGHSFGTHMIGWGVAGLSSESKIFIHSIILSGSVLRTGFPWRDLIGARIGRVINDCGTKDAILLLSQFLILFTGMAGRTGFGGATSGVFRNRYSAFGHSGYFQDSNGETSDNYMRKYWLPLLTSDDPISQFDARTGGAIEGIVTVLGNNAEPIKLFVYTTPFALLIWYIYGLYGEADSQRKIATANESHALTALSRVAIENHRPVDAAKLALAAWPQTVRSWDARPRLEMTLRTLSLAMRADPWFIHEMRHTDVVFGAILTKDERRILSWSKDGTLRLWDVATGQQVGPAMRHEAAVYGALLTKDEQRIISWSEDATLRLWDVATAQQIVPAMKHEDWVNGARLSGDEQSILSWSFNVLHLWDTKTGQQIGPAMKHRYLVRAALLTKDGRRILSWSADGLRLWDAATGQQIGPAIRDQIIDHAVLTKDERRILSWSENTLSITGQQIDRTMKHEGPVQGALFTEDERRILSW
jgi:hypothetical protein